MIDFEYWLRRIEDGRSVVERLREGSKKYREAFAARYPIPYPEEEESEQVYVHRVHRVVIQWKGAMYPQEPKVYLEPPSYAVTNLRKKLNIQEAILNSEIRRVHLEETFDRCVQTAFLDGWSVAKQGFHAEWEYEAEDLAEATTNVDAETQAFMLGEPSLFPQKVLLREDHAEHIRKHLLQHQQMKAQLQTFMEQVRSLIQQGGEPPDNAQPEAQRLMLIIQAIEQHIRMHKVAKERYEKEGMPANARIVAEECWVDYVHNENFIWDIHATGPHDWRWVAELIIRPLQEFKANRRLKHRDELTSNYTRAKPGAGEPTHPRGAGRAVRSETLEEHAAVDDDDPDALCGIWKIWDIEHREVIYIHEGVKKFISKEKWPHQYLTTAPYSMLFFEREEDEFIPIPQARYFWDLQMELNRNRTKAGIITRRLSRAAVADEALSDEDLTRLTEARDGEIVKIRLRSGMKANEVFHPVDWGSVPIDVYQLASVADNDMQIDTGLGGVNLGSGDKAKTATAAQVQRESVGVTLTDKMREGEKFIIHIVTNLRNLMRQYYVSDRYVEYMEEGAKEFESWNGDDLELFPLRVELGASRRQENDIKKMQMLQLLQALSPMGALGLNLEWLTRRVLEAFGIRNTDEAFIDRTTQMAQQALMGPGQGQNQQALGEGTSGAASRAPMDRTKVGP